MPRSPHIVESRCRLRRLRCYFERSPSALSFFLQVTVVHAMLVLSGGPDTETFSLNAH